MGDMFDDLEKRRKKKSGPLSEDDTPSLDIELPPEKPMKKLKLDETASVDREERPKKRKRRNYEPSAKDAAMALDAYKEGS